MTSCLLCGQSSAVKNEEQGTPLNLLGRQLKAVFVLRELLRLPPEKLTGFLGRSGGDHPHEWINFCDPCQLLVDKAFSLFEQKVHINRKLKKVQQEVAGKVKESSGGNEGIAKETSDFVENHDYGPWEDPFVAGDWEAEWRVETQKVRHRTEKEDVTAKEEVDADYPDQLPVDPNSSSSDDEPVPPKLVKRQKKRRKRIRPKEDPSTLICEPCGGRVFSSRHALNEHQAVFHFICGLVRCGVQLENKEQLHAHQVAAHGREVYVFHCPKCEDYYMGRKAFLRHQPACQSGRKPKKNKRRGQNPPPKQPLEEGETFTNSSGQLMYRCLEPNCALEYDNRSSFLRHKAFHRDNPELWLTCDHCSQSCYGKKGLKLHLYQMHPDLYERPFPCTECPVRCSTANSLKFHARIAHRGYTYKKEVPRRRRQCPHCPYSTVKSASSISHVKEKHDEGQRAFTCGEHCGKGVSYESILRTHQAIHHSICGVRTCRAQLEGKEQLHAHDLHVHGKEVNIFQCQECNEYFFGQKILKDHQQLKHPPGDGGGEGQHHICEQCGKSFPIEKYLKYHVTFTHNKAQRRKRKSE